MDEAGDESLLQHLAKDNVSAAVSEDNAGKKRCSNLSTEDMDNKENLCTTSENRSDFATISRAMPPTRRVKRGGGCNLRKSLTWNKAFFTEEGVLDPLELSILSGSTTKSSVGLSTGISGEMSPLMSYGVSGRANLDNEVHQGSAFGDKKGDDLFSTLEPSGHKDSVAHVVPEKATLCKGICRNIPRAPAAFSQKRLANTNMPNPASKLPKFTATKSQTSSLTPTARCSASTKGHSNQNIKTVNIEQNARSKGSSLSLKKALNYPASSSRSSGHVYDEKKVNETSELHSSADMQTTEMGKCTGYLRTPQSHLPPNRLSASLGSSNFEKVAHSFPQKAQHIQGVHPPVRVQARPSGLRMPTPSLGFFCQAKIPPHGVELQKESQKSSAFDHSCQSLRKINSLKHPDDLKTLHASYGQGQQGGLGSTGTKVSAIVVSTPFTTKNTDFSGDLIVPSVTNPTLSSDIGLESSRSKILKSATKSQVASSQENDQEELHSDCLMNEDNMGKHSGGQGFGCEPESPNGLVLSTDNSSLLMGRKIANTLTQTNHFENAGGMYLASEDSGRHQLVKSSVILQKCSPKQLQQGDCGIGGSVTCQQLKDACETSISADNECLPNGKCDLFSGLSFGNNGKGVDRCALLEIETSLRSSKTQISGSTSLLVCSSTENVASSVEGENIECTVHGMGQHGLNSDTNLLEEVHSTEKSELQDCGVPFQREENQIASQDESEVILNKQELMEKSKQGSVLLNQLKAAPFSDEWVTALESFGEDILQMKTGAVQNSPPDKPAPEPSPWSPVKRKNQDIGPYDCTKYTTSLSTSSTQ